MKSARRTVGIKSADWKIKADEGLTLEMSALKLFTVANFRYQLSRQYQITPII